MSHDRPDLRPNLPRPPPSMSPSRLKGRRHRFLPAPPSATSTSRSPISTARCLLLRCARLRADAALRHAGRVRFGRRDHHHIGLNTWGKSKGERVLCNGDWPLSHGHSLSRSRRTCRCAAAGRRGWVYARRRRRPWRQRSALPARHPDGNGVGLHRDRPPQEWPVDANGHLKMENAPIDCASCCPRPRPSDCLPADGDPRGEQGP